MLFCTRLVPEVFGSDEDGSTWAKTGPVPRELESVVLEAVEMCPNQAISASQGIDLDALLRPRTIAVVGASEQRSGGRIILALQRSGYRGTIYPVNPNRDTVLDLACYPNVSEVPDSIDCAYLATPAHTIPGIIEELGEADVRAAVVYASGFSEAGEAGENLQRDLTERAVRRGLALCGPNSFGFINTLDAIAPFGGVEGTDRPGPIGIVSQSAGFLDAIRSSGSEVRAGMMINSGGEAVLSTGNYLQYLLEDDRLTCFGLIIEGVNGVESLRNSLHAARIAGKPVVVLKTGVSDRGRLATLSHTGFLAGDRQAWEAFFRRYGAIQVEDLDEFLETLVLAAGANVSSGGVALVGTSGGKAALFADMAERSGLDLVDLDPATNEQLAGILGDSFTGLNPVDTGIGGVLADPTKVKATIQSLARDQGVDLVGVFGDLPVDNITHPALLEYTKIPLEAASSVAANTGTEIVFVNTRAGRLTSAARKQLGFDDVVILNGARSALRAIANLVRWQRNRKDLTTDSAMGATPAGQGDVHPAAKRARAVLDGLSTSGEVMEVRRTSRLLDLYGLRQPDQAEVGSAEEAVEFADRIGYPVVVKLVSPTRSHKSDAGWVRLDVRNAESLGRHFAELEEDLREMPLGDGVILVQKMIEVGTEVLVGLKQVGELGHLLAVGAGGVLVELLEDVSFELLPVDRQTAALMLERTRVSQLLKGDRGRRPADLEGLLDFLETASRLGTDLGPDLLELDFNPLIVMQDGQGTYAVDVRLVASSPVNMEIDNGKS